MIVRARTLPYLLAGSMVIAMGGCSTSLPPDVSSPTPTALAAAELHITASGLVRHEVIPDFVTGYMVELTDPGARTFEGFFEDPRTGPTPPGTTLVGDVPTRVRPGHYSIRFSMERVSDQNSFVPVPGGTPFSTNRERIMSCATAFDAQPGEDIDIEAHFALVVPDGGAPDGTCTIEVAPV